jgi:hypothetical protein
MKAASAFLATALTLLLVTTETFAQSTAAVSSPLPPVPVHRGAPGPLMGAGPVGLVIGGVGYGVYWLVRRRRKAS